MGSLQSLTASDSYGNNFQKRTSSTGKYEQCVFLVFGIEQNLETYGEWNNQPMTSETYQMGASCHIYVLQRYSTSQELNHCSGSVHELKCRNNKTGCRHISENYENIMVVSSSQ